MPKNSGLKDSPAKFPAITAAGPAMIEPTIASLLMRPIRNSAQLNGSNTTAPRSPIDKNPMSLESRHTRTQPKK